MKSFLCILFLIAAQVAQAAPSPIDGSWKITNVACSSGAAPNATNVAALIQDTVSTTFSNGTVTFLGNYDGCSITGTCNFSLNGFTISVTNSVTSFGSGCGIATGSQKQSADTTETYALSGNTLTISSAGTGSICPAADTVNIVYIKQ